MFRYFSDRRYIFQRVLHGEREAAEGGLDGSPAGFVGGVGMGRVGDGGGEDLGHVGGGAEGHDGGDVDGVEGGDEHEGMVVVAG